MIHLISGPVVLSGTPPFTFRGFDKTFADFQMHVKQSMMLPLP